MTAVLTHIVVAKKHFNFQRTIRVSVILGTIDWRGSDSEKERFDTFQHT